LALNRVPDQRTPIARADVDWDATTAWADGGYYGRVFLNVEGREPRGTVSAGRYEELRELIINRIERLTDHHGRPMGNRVFRPEDVYPEVKGVPPDLIVYFGDLRWRAVGSLGLGRGFYTFDNDTGPDDANHSELGFFMLSGTNAAPECRNNASIYDIAPTVQEILGLKAPCGQHGQSLI